MPTSAPESKAPALNDVSAALFLGAWIAGLALSFHPGRFGFGHGFEMATIARNLVEHGVFGNPFGVATGPTAVVPPLYPLFLAAMIKIFGEVLPAALIANIAANALTAAFLPRLSRVFYGDARPGVFAGVLWIAAMPLMPEWDVSFTIALEVVGCYLLYQTIGRERGAVWAAATSGLLAGLASLLNPVALLIFAAWAVSSAVSRSVPARQALRYGAILILVVALCNAPWLARNYRLWHAFVLRTNFGMTLYSSNNDCAQASLFEDGANGCYQTTHPIASPAEARLLSQLGEVAYDRRRTADAWRWIRSHPARFAALTAKRIVEFWFPDPTAGARRVYTVWLITLLSLPGIVRMRRAGRHSHPFVLFVWLVYPLVYYLAVSADRYRDPILWTSLLPAGYWLAAIGPVVNWQPYRARLKSARTPRANGTL